MISMRIEESEKRVYIDVNGYINAKESREFLTKYKQQTRGIKSSQYTLVVTPSVFECETNEDIRSVCMSFFKTGYKKIYLVDPNSYIMSIMSLGPLEKKILN